MNQEEVALLRKEIELLMRERAKLLKVVGAAALFVADMKPELLPVAAVNTADKLSESLNALSEESLKDALEAV
ncbi:MAG: hypothetical protein ACOY3V_01725 [Pseudomonadota bacterium]